jgi:hypothetical protein
MYDGAPAKRASPSDWERFSEKVGILVEEALSFRQNPGIVVENDVTTTQLFRHEKHIVGTSYERLNKRQHLTINVLRVIPIKSMASVS